MSALPAEVQHCEPVSSDPIATLFEPDVVLPSQFFKADRGGLLGGERKLMAALLADGVEAYIHASARLSHVVTTSDVRRSEALEWVHTKDTSYIFSFDNVCECLGINADYLRLGLMRYTRALREHQGTAWRKIRRPRK